MAKKILLVLIRFYRKYLSPLKTTKCPYYPTCSTYGLQAVEKYGALKGGLLAAWRILRCNPFSKGGYDPVPDFTEDVKKRHSAAQTGERKIIPPGTF